MATHDYVIANGSGAAVRSDLNDALAAIVSQNSSATAPATTFAYMRWADTTAGVMKMRNGANNAWITLYQLDGEWSTIAFENGSAAAPSIYFKDSGTDTGIYSPGTDQVAISTGGTGRLFVDSSGRVGLGTSSPGNLLHVSGTGTVCQLASSNNNNLINLKGNGATNGVWLGTTSSDDFLISSGASISERARIDSNGRLLVGTSSALSNVARFGADATPTTQFLTNTESWSTGLGLINYSPSGFAPALTFGLSGSSTVGTNAVVSSGNRLGLITFNGNDGTNFEEGARIEAFVDGTPGANDMPGRLVFSTTADGAASPTERFRISSDGSLSSVIPGGSTLYPRFGCRAWVNFNGTGTVAIRASGNVSSITDNGVGNYTVNLTTALTDTNAAPVTSGMRFGASASRAGKVDANIASTTTVRLLTGYEDSFSGQIPTDLEFTHVAIFR